jgi:hypothetical protein
VSHPAPASPVRTSSNGRAVQPFVGIGEDLHDRGVKLRTLRRRELEQLARQPPARGNAAVFADHLFTSSPTLPRR